MIGYKTITVLRDESSSIIEYPAVLCCVVSDWGHVTVFTGHFYYDRMDGR
jgi:hypothetical protein